MRAVLILLLVIGCAHSSKEQARVEVHEDTQIDTTEHRIETQTVREGPEHVVTTVRKYAPPKGGDASEPVADSGRISEQRGRADTRGAVTEPEHGPLLEETVTVVDRGPTTTETRAEAKGASTARVEAEVHAEASSESKWSWGPPWWAYVLGGVGVVAAALVVWKMRPPWLRWPPWR